MKKLSLVLAITIILAFTTPVSAGIEPSPFIVGKLDSISNSMSVINQRINDAYTRMGIGPSPFIPFVNQLGAIDNQLNHLHDRLVDVSLAIEEQNVAELPEVITAMSHILVGAQTIALNLQSISRDLAGTAFEDLKLILAQAATSADSITEIFNPYNPGLSVPDGLYVNENMSAFNALEIGWNPVENATGYLIQRSENSTGPWTDFDAPSLLTHVLYDPISDDLYEFFRVRAYRNFGSTRWYSAWSDPVGGTANSDEVPSNFRTTSTSTSITVNWDPTNMATGYQVHVYQLLEGSTHYYTLVTETTKTVNDLSPETDYYVDVRYYRTYPGSIIPTDWGTPTPPLYIKTKAP